MAEYGIYPKEFTESSEFDMHGLTLPGTANDASDNGSVYKPGSYIHRLMKGVTIADSKSFTGFTPFITGRNILIVTKMPRFLEIVLPKQTELLRHLIQFYTKSVTGFQDLSLVTTDIDNGIEAAAIPIPTSVSGATKEINMEFGPEIKGLFISKMLKAWICGMVDTLTHTGTYLGAFDKEDGKNLRWENSNHTMEAIHIVTDPTKRIVESHALIVGMMPKSAPGSMLDSTQGQHDFVHPQVTFTAQVFTDLPAISKALKDIDILGYMRTARYNTVNMSHVIEGSKYFKGIQGEVSRINKSFDANTGLQDPTSA